jgi:hypothetical protein
MRGFVHGDSQTPRAFSIRSKSCSLQAAFAVIDFAAAHHERVIKAQTAN